MTCEMTQDHQGASEVVTVSARYQDYQPAYNAYDADGISAHLELSADDRITPPRRGRAARWVRRIILLLTLALGGGWISQLEDKAAWWAWLQTEAVSMASAIESRVRSPAPDAPAAPIETPAAAPVADPEPAAKSAPPWPPPLPAPRLVSNEPAAAAASPSVPAPATPPSPITTASLPAPAGSTGKSDGPSAYAPAKSQTVEPYQKRAEAAGLHPELSRALLERLSPTDYRNADVAIKTAMAETADTGVFVWPRQRRPDLALFEVRFVSGAARDCRRYVVSILKDGWATTAMPMEKCGVRRRTARREP